MGCAKDPEPEDAGLEPESELEAAEPTGRGGAERGLLGGGAQEAEAGERGRPHWRAMFPKKGHLRQRTSRRQSE